MPTISSFLLERLISNGVRHIFGVPGEYNCGFCKDISKSKISLINTISEESAGFAADAYARVNGMGVVCTDYCVGGFKVLNPVACAFAERSPLIFISGSPGIKERDVETLHKRMIKPFECQHEIFSNVTCANTVLRDQHKAGYEIDRVIEAAKHYKQPVYIELPRDMVDKSLAYDAYTLGTPSIISSDPQNLLEVLGETTEWINSAKSPIIWAGVELARYGIGQKVMKFAETNNIPIVTDILGKSVVNEKHPLCLGVYGENISSNELVEFFTNCDCVIMLGVIMTEMNLGFLPARCKKRNTVNANIDGIQVKNHNYKNVQFVDFVEGLCKAKLNHKPNRLLPTKPLKINDEKLTTGKLIDKIDTVINENMVVISDFGDALFRSLGLTIHRHNQFLAAAFYTTRGFSVPAAVGVQLANNKLRPIVLVGSDAFQMTGYEFSTIVNLNLNPIIVILNNYSKWNFENIPALVGGGKGYLVKNEKELDLAIAEAVSLKIPTIINVIVSDCSSELKRILKGRC